MRRNIRTVLAAGFLAISVNQVANADVNPTNFINYDLNEAKNVAPSTAQGTFGDSFSPYNGSVVFNVADIIIQGNSGLPVQFRRSFDVVDRSDTMGRIGGMGDWDIDVPFLSSTFLEGDYWSATWPGTNQKTSSRCSATEAPLSVPPFHTSDFWGGVTLHVPGEVNEILLISNPAISPNPQDGFSYPWVSRSFWTARCLPQTTNGYAGEGFLVVSPMGVKYTFTHMTERDSTLVSGSMSGTQVKDRTKFFLLATRVEDRFGNFVSYSYNQYGLPVSITSNDGRQIILTYTGSLLQSAQTSDGRYWSYSYSNNKLVQVTSPGGSKWQYSIIEGELKSYGPTADEYEPHGNCEHKPSSLRRDGYFTYRVTTPFGAVGTFEFVVRGHPRDGTPKNCSGWGFTGATADSRLDFPNYFFSFSLMKKTIVGPGMAEAIWTYPYPGFMRGKFKNDCAGATCPRSRNVAVLNPDGTKDEYIVGTRWFENEGLLLGIRKNVVGGAAAEDITYSYVTDDFPNAAFPYSQKVGNVPNALKHTDNAAASYIYPKVSTTIRRDGVVFRQRAEMLDQYGRPLRVVRESGSNL